MGWRDDDAIGEPDGAGRLPTVRAEDRVRHPRSGRAAVAVIDEHLDAVRHEDLEGRLPGGLGQAVGVAADEEGPVEPLGGPVFADGLRCREDMVLVERRVETRAAVPGRAEDHLLVGVLGVRVLVVIGGDELVDVDEVAVLGGLSCARVGHQEPSFDVDFVGRCFVGPAGCPAGSGTSQTADRRGTVMVAAWDCCCHASGRASTTTPVLLGAPGW